MSEPYLSSNVYLLVGDDDHVKADAVIVGEEPFLPQYRKAIFSSPRLRVGPVGRQGVVS